VLCLDLKVWLGQEQGGAAKEGDSKGLVWRYDLAKELKAVQDHVSSCSVLIHGDYIYVCTGNERWKNHDRPYFPLTPSLIMLNKKTGQLVGRDDEQIVARVWRGAYSSPSLGAVDKKEQLYFGGGDGVCYAFEPLKANVTVPPGRWVETTQRGPIVQFYKYQAAPSGQPRSDIAPASDEPAPAVPGPNVVVEKRIVMGRIPVCSPLGALPTAKVPDVPLLKKIWWCDCIPEEYRKNPYSGQDAKPDGKGRPCEFIATPVFYHNRVYVAIGGDPYVGGAKCLGSLLCLDATKSGDVTHTGVVWKYQGLQQSASTVAIGEGLVFALDEAYGLHCLDAETGQCYWTHQVMKGTGYQSPLLADGKLFVGGSILAAGKELKVLSSGLPAPQYSTPCVANGVLFTVLEKRLWAICDKGDKKPPAEKSAEKSAEMSAEKAAK
jgi:outer membrane protein assembly factor BamB